MSGKLRKRIRKFTGRLLVVVVLAGFLLYFAHPDAHFFWPGVGLALLGEAIRIWATGHLDKNERLTMSGPYAHVKNPMYIGTFLIMLSMCSMAHNPFVPIMGVAIFVFYYAPKKKRVEMGHLAEKFGQAFVDYDKNVRDYLPRLSAYKADPTPWSWARMTGNSEIETAFSVLFGIAAIGSRFFFSLPPTPMDRFFNL